MRLVNLTKWETRDLRKLVSATFRAYPVDARKYVVEVRPRRRLGTRGYAWYGLPRIVVFVPNPSLLRKTAREYEEMGSGFRPPTDFDSVAFARVLTHEIAHTLGVRHRDMPPLKTINADWAGGFTVRPR